MTDTPAEREDQSIWARLRRRKVVQWGLVYVAAAWGFLQGLEYISESFNWPQHVRQIAVLALVIGLPIVLVLAWYHGDRGEQRISTPEFAILTLLLLLGGGAFWYYQHESGKDAAAPTASAVQPDASPGIKDARPSVAVLPFENRSREADDAFFVDGIHDDIVTQLTKIGALKVIARTSVEQFRQTKLTAKEIGEKLGVTKILEGGVQRAGDRVRITVQLIDASTEGHVWAENYDRELTAANIFAIQSELAVAIAGALEAALTPAEKARANAVPTRNLKAWEAYQLGKQRVESRTSAGLAEAEEHFRRAVALDPHFALAWVGLADTLAWQTFYSGRPRDAGLDEATQAVGRALELDANLAEAWASAGNIANGRLQFERGEQLLRRAIALNPNYALAHHWLSSTLGDLGRRDEALAMAEQAVALDPLSAVINNQLGFTRAAVGRFDDALVAFRQAIEIDPAMPASYANIGDVQAYGFGRFGGAIPWYDKAASLDPGSADVTSAVAQVYWELGDDVEAQRTGARALAIGDGNATASAVAALLDLERSDLESARRHSQRAAELDPFYLFLVRDDDVRKGDYSGARARYSKVFPDLFVKDLPPFTDRDAFAAVDLALVLQHTGDRERANELLERSEAYFQTIPRTGFFGYRIADVAIYALRSESAVALRRLREAEKAGWRQGWRYYRDFDPNLASIRNEPEFKAVFADIERDMAQQRARLAARPKDAPLELTDASR